MTEPQETSGAEVVPLRPDVPEPEPVEAVEDDPTTIAYRRAVQQRPIVPAWVVDAQQRREAVRWAAGYVTHALSFHGLRAPKYAGKVLFFAPRGFGRLVADLANWVGDAEGRPLRKSTTMGGDATTYLALSRQRNERVKIRIQGVIMAFLTICTVLGVVEMFVGRGRVLLIIGVALLVASGWRGRPKDSPLVDHAVITQGRAARLTSDVVIRALGALGIAEVNKALGPKGEGITFAAPITRDGPGWRADVDLPYGVTAVDIIDKRDRVASGLRRPLGCVWPEPVHDQHAGRLSLWVGDQDMNAMRPPTWPLLRAGKTDIFRPLPFATDQRGRPVDVELMFSNILIGAIPRQGKTVTLRGLLLGAALDPIVELNVWELKGTGDLSPLAKVARTYGSGPDDATIEACVDNLREVYGDLEQRAKVITDLPRDLVPENKVTRQVAAKRSLGLHPRLIAVDECQELFSHPESGKDAERYCTAIIKRGPALGIMLALATQRPDKDSLPTSISANVGIRFCLRVMGQVETDMICGTSMYRNGVRPNALTPKDKGIGYLVGVFDDPRIARSYYLDAIAADKIADRARAARKAAGLLTGYAAGEVVEPAPEVSLLDDLLVVLQPGEDKVHSDVLCSRLAELRPGLYGSWTPATLADAIKRYGLETRQVWAATESGEQRNRRGLEVAEVRRAAETRSGADVR